MKFFSKLEFKYGKYAIQNLMTYLTALYAAGLVISLMLPQVYYAYLALDAGMILKGQVWRLITWLLYPPTSGIFFGALMLFVYYNIGTNLERIWGSFKFNVFIFTGILLHIIAAFIIYAIPETRGTIWILTPASLNMSILLAFITTFPDARFLLFFFIPIKASWLGAFYVAMTLVDFITGGPAQKISVAVSLLNVIIFLVMTGKWRQIVNDVKSKIQK